MCCHVQDGTLTLRVAPPGPTSRCLRLTNLSLFLTRDLILMMSHATSSSSTRNACRGSAQWQCRLNSKGGKLYVEPSTHTYTHTQTHLFVGHAPSQQFDHVPRLEDAVRVPCLTGGGHCHTPLHQVQTTGDTLGMG